MCEGSICAGDFDAARTYDLWSAEERERRWEVDIGARNWWFIRSMKDCPHGGGGGVVVIIVMAVCLFVVVVVVGDVGADDLMLIVSFRSVC